MKDGSFFKKGNGKPAATSPDVTHVWTPDGGLQAVQ